MYTNFLNHVKPERSTVHLVFLLLPVLLLVQCTPRNEPATYLIPEGYTGKVVIILNQPQGAAKKYEGDRRLYEITERGVLVSQFSDEWGTANQEFYYVDHNGRRSPLEVYDEKVFREDKRPGPEHKEYRKIAIFFPAISGRSDPDISFESFYVSSIAGIDGLMNETYESSFGKMIEQLTGLNLYD